MSSPDPTPLNTLYCGFCGRADDQVKVLVAGPLSFICDGCIDLAKATAQEAIRAGQHQADLPLRAPANVH
jgi:ATP-dependent Clp protease ATP-binding subunit ClpX